MPATTTDQELKPLGRSIKPYVWQALVCAGVTIYIAYDSYQARQWEFMWFPPLLWVLYAIILYFDLKYRVFWDETGVVMHTTGGSEKRIPFDEIATIDSGLIRPGGFRTQPSWHIMIRGDRPEASIDISLRHFRLEDIQTLLATIHAKRPDLTLPELPNR
jgi:hypothetical protein